MTLMSDKLKETLGIIETSNMLMDILPRNSVVDADFVPRESKKFEITKKKSNVKDLSQTDAAEDYKHARDLTYSMLGMLGDAVAGAYEVAKESEHPRAYGVFNELANTMRLLTQDLLAMQKIYKEVTKDNEEAKLPPVLNTQNNFYGSTAEILKLVEESEKLNKKK